MTEINAVDEDVGVSVIFPSFASNENVTV